MKFKKQLFLILYLITMTDYCLAEEPTKKPVSKPVKVEELKIPQFEKNSTTDQTITLYDLTAPMSPGSQGKVIFKILPGTKLTIKPSEAFNVVNTEVQDNKITYVITMNPTIKSGMVPVEVTGDKDGVTHTFKTFIFVEHKK